MSSMGVVSLAKSGVTTLISLRHVKREGKNDGGSSASRLMEGDFAPGLPFGEVALEGFDLLLKLKNERFSAV